MPDALKDGRFVIVGTLGEGTQGHTFDGVDKREGRAVAIKRFDVRTAKTWKDAELAERETRVLQTLSHPRLPKYRDHFEQDGALYLVMDRIDGESLAALQKRGGTLGEDDVLRLLHDASEALDYLHGRAPPVIHRDLKPGNVIRRPDGSFAFVDFGAVRDKLRPDGGSTVIGTFGFMAPEQFQGRALPASDVYAIGATALSMLTGRQPEDLPHKGLAIDVRAALEGRARRPLVEALTAMLDPDPDRRAARIAPLLAKLEGHGRSRRSSAPEPARSPRAAAEDLGTRFAHFVRHAQEYEERARDYEQRAAAGGPYSKGWLRGAEGWRKGAEKWRVAAERHAQQLAYEAERHARRRARKEGRRAQRAARRASSGRRRPPWPAIFLVLVLTLAMVSVGLVMEVAVPALLRLLSLFVATRSLRAASTAVHEAGEVMIDGMTRSRHFFMTGESLPRPLRRDESPEEGSRSDDRVRVETDGDGPKVRVRPGAETDGEHEESAEDEEVRDVRR